MRKSLPLLALLALAGCGGHDAAPASAASRGGGSATVTIAWPARSRLVPLTANSAVVVLSLGRAEAARRTVVRSGDGASVGSAAFAGLALGRYAVDVRAYPAGDGTGVASALGAATLVVGKAPATLSAVLDSTVTSLTLNAYTSKLKVGEYISLTMTAKDRDGNLVLLDNAGIQEPVDWSVSPANVGSMYIEGPLIYVKGVAPGDAHVIARLRVRDDGTTVEGSFAIQVVAQATGLAATGWPTVGGGYGATYAGRGPAASGTSIVSGADAGNLIVGPNGTVYSTSGDKVSARGVANWEAIGVSGTVYSRLALTQGGILLAGSNKDLVAYDATTGKRLWNYGGPLSPDARSAPFLVGREGTVYAQGAGWIVALDGATGLSKWYASSTTISAVGEDGALYGFATHRVTQNPNSTVVYVIAYDPTNGAQRWSALVGPTNSASPLSVSGVSAAGGAVYVNVSSPSRTSPDPDYRAQGFVLALNANNGARRWAVDYDQVRLDPSSSVGGLGGERVAVRDGRVFAQWGGYAMGIDAATGQRLWTVPAGHQGQVATAADGTVYCALGGANSWFSQSPGLLVLDPATGATRWNAPLGAGNVAPGALTLADDGTVYVDTSQGVFTVR